MIRSIFFFILFLNSLGVEASTFFDVSLLITRPRHSRFAPILNLTETRKDRWEMLQGFRQKTSLKTSFGSFLTYVVSGPKNELEFFIDSCDLTRAIGLTVSDNCDILDKPLWIRLQSEAPFTLNIPLSEEESFGLSLQLVR